MEDAVVPALLSFDQLNVLLADSQLASFVPTYHSKSVWVPSVWAPTTPIPSTIPPPPQNNYPQRRASRPLPTNVSPAKLRHLIRQREYRRKIRETDPIRHAKEKLRSRESHQNRKQANREYYMKNREYYANYMREYKRRKREEKIRKEEADWLNTCFNDQVFCHQEEQ